MAQPKSHFMSAGHQPDPCPNRLVERAHHGLGVGPWVPADKHRYLCEYLWATRYAWASPAWKARVLLDPFCGPGRIQVRGENFTRDGGVVAAWRESVASGAPFTHILIGDKDPARANDCAGRLRALGAPVQSFTGPASDTVPLMVKAVPGQALTLAYVDPYNLELLRFDMFQALAPLRVDIAAHFSTMDLHRNVEMEFDPQRDRFDGTAPGWRTHPEIIGVSKKNVPLQFLRYWQDKVVGLGYVCSQAMPLVHNDEGHALYRLVFFARSDWPMKIWGDIARSGVAQRGFDF